MDRRSLMQAVLTAPMAMFVGIDKFRTGDTPIDKLLIDLEMRSDGLYARYLHRDGSDSWSNVFETTPCEQGSVKCMESSLRSQDA